VPAGDDRGLLQQLCCNPSSLHVTDCSRLNVCCVSPQINADLKPSAAQPVDDEISAHLLADAEIMVKAQQSQQPLQRGKLQKKNACKKKGELKQKGNVGKNEIIKKRKRDVRGFYHRKTTGGVGKGDSFSCCVLLTRLDEKRVVNKVKSAKYNLQRSVKVKKKKLSVSRSTKSGLVSTSTANQQTPEPKSNQEDALLMLASPVVEPRRRRMASLNAEAVNSLLLYRDGSMMANLTKKSQPSGEDADRDPKAKNVSAGGKRAKKQKDQAESIDWLSLLAPTPRRQAGLTAATLLKLTGSQYKTKRQKKTESGQGGSNVDPVCGGTTQTKTRRPHDKPDEPLKHRQPDAEFPAPSKMSCCCGLCQPGAAAGHGFQRGSSLGFPLKTIKEEQMEAEVTSCFCCSQERCVEYFAHPAAITISPHTYTCFPGYYVHFTHPDGPPSPMALCPRSSKRPKLHPSAGPQPSGIRHPVYCCTSVEACYGEPCRINGYSYPGVIPAITRGGCSYTPKDCAKCNQGIKREEYSPSLGDHHGPSFIPMCPTPRVLTGCPVPTVPPAGQSVPHIQTPPSDPCRPQPPLQVAKECPQSAKPPRSGSRSGARGGLAVPPLNRDKNQRLSAASVGGQTVPKQPKNSRQKPTNGWRSLGQPFEKEVFVVGEEAPVLRKCFEGIRRDGDEIRVRDTVLLKSGPRKKSLPYVAKVSALWEEPESGELMMSLFWYYRPEHTQGGRNPTLHCENEIFASRHQDVNSVACIEDKCYVLTLAQYCRFCALVKRRREGVRDSATSLVVPPVLSNAMPTHHCVPDDVDPELVLFCRHVYDFRYGRLLKNLQ
uniref:Bromo adjacent homology domain containing 1 n=1 Tax=Poecilia reticulata TaxID=8081 RepID=A0A3P9PRU1_POERE